MDTKKPSKPEDSKAKKSVMMIMALKHNPKMAAEMKAKAKAKC